MSNVFDQFVTAEKKVKITALKGEVTLRELTVAERKRVDTALSIESTRDGEGKVLFSPISYQNAQILAVSIALVEPKMTVKELEKLSSSAYEAISEIHEAILELGESNSKKK